MPKLRVTACRIQIYLRTNFLNSILNRKPLPTVNHYCPQCLKQFSRHNRIGQKHMLSPIFSHGTAVSIWNLAPSHFRPIGNVFDSTFPFPVWTAPRPPTISTPDSRDIKDVTLSDAPMFSISPNSIHAQDTISIHSLTPSIIYSSRCLSVRPRLRWRHWYK